MICPHCKHDMIVVEYSEVEMDYCPNCEGVWFDSGELELLLGCAGIDQPGMVLGDVSALPGKPSGRRCPVCRHAMHETPIGHPPVDIDVCREDGLWFDGGELHALLKQVPPQSGEKNVEQPVITFLKDVFQAAE